jgi:hypothetical protein
MNLIATGKEGAYNVALRRVRVTVDRMERNNAFSILTLRTLLPTVKHT